MVDNVVDDVPDTGARGIAGDGWLKLNPVSIQANFDVENGGEAILLVV